MFCPVVARRLHLAGIVGLHLDMVNKTGCVLPSAGINTGGSPRLSALVALLLLVAPLTSNGALSVAYEVVLKHSLLTNGWNCPNRNGRRTSSSEDCKCFNHAAGKVLV
jgi:hypothetical protein